MELKLKTNPSQMNENGELIHPNNNISEFDNSYDAASNMTVAEKRDYYDDLDVNEPFTPTLTTEALESLSTPKYRETTFGSILFLICFFSFIFSVVLGVIYFFIYMINNAEKNIIKNSYIKTATVIDAKSVEAHSHKRKEGNVRYYDTEWTQKIVFEYEDKNKQINKGELKIEIDQITESFFNEYDRMPTYTGSERAPKYRTRDQFEVYVDHNHAEKVYEKAEIDNGVMAGGVMIPLISNVLIILVALFICSLTIYLVCDFNYKQ